MVITHVPSLGFLKIIVVVWAQMILRECFF